jgi:hypothetical protein
MIFGEDDLIYSYSREDAIRDGVLIPTTDLVPDEEDFSRTSGWLIPVALTASVAALVTPTEWETKQGQSVKGRLWDVLSMARMYHPRGGSPEYRYPCRFVLGPADERRVSRAGTKTLHLKAVVSGGDDGSPVLTIMLPEED